MTDPVPNSGFIRSKDGTQLYYCSLPAREAPATLLFVHGYGEHCGRYEHVMRWFHGRGYDVSAFDYRGHGRSEGTRGHIARFREYIDDLDAFIGTTIGRLGTDHKVYLVGHSIGGLIAASYVLEQPEGIDGVVLSSPCFGFAVKVGAVKNILGKGMSSIWPTLALPTGIPPEDLSTDPAVGRAYDADPLVNKNATARWYTEALTQQQTVLRHADRIRVPVLLLQAGSDRVADPDTSQNFIAALGSNDKEMQWYDGLYHEIFNEVQKEDVFSDLETWLQKHN